MKILIATSRVLLGLILKVFGLNGLLHFIPARVASQLMGGFLAADIPRLLFVVASVGSTFLVINRQVPLVVTMLSLVVGSIVSVQLFNAPAGLPIALFIALLWLVVVISVRAGIRELFTNAWKRSASAFRSKKTKQRHVKSVQNVEFARGNAC